MGSSLSRDIPLIMNVDIRGIIQSTGEILRIRESRRRSALISNCTLGFSFDSVSLKDLTGF